MSPDGILKIVDRRKNIFKLSQGEYVAAEYLERIYVGNPIVDDVSLPHTLYICFIRLHPLAF